MFIHCTERWLTHACQSAGIPWEQCRQCIEDERDGKLRVSPAHPHYPRNRQVVAAKAVNGGPGTELKKLLKRFGIVARPTCSCNNRAQEMDVYGYDWCEQNIPKIVGWLRDEAAKRKLPFADFVGRTLVKLAIARARKGNGKGRD